MALGIIAVCVGIGLIYLGFRDPASRCTFCRTKLKRLPKVVRQRSKEWYCANPACEVYEFGEPLVFEEDTT